MKVHVRVMAALRFLSGVFSFGLIGDGQALKRVGDEIVGGDLTASEVGAVPDTHDADGQLRIPAVYPVEQLSAVAIPIEFDGDSELESARVCEFLREGVVVARARLP